MKTGEYSIARVFVFATVFLYAMTGRAFDQKSGLAQSDDMFDFRPREGVEGFLDYYQFNIEWGQPKTLSAAGRLELISASTYGPNISVTRFQPRENEVEVFKVSVSLKDISHQSKWPDDIAPVEAKRGLMKPNDYKKLLHDIARIESAKLTLKDKPFGSPGYYEEWIQVEFFTERKPSISMFWFGDGNFDGTGRRTKTLGANLVCGRAIENVEFSDAELTDNDRAWASKMFTRQWRRVDMWSSREEKFEEALIVLIGAIGDNEALSKLGRVIRHYDEPKLVYHAINAVTRITGKDLRTKPVEEMDLEANKEQILDLIKQRRVKRN